MSVKKLLNYFEYSVNIHLSDFGFTNWQDFIQSTFHLSNFKPILLVSVTLGTVASFCEDYLGIEAMVYVAFVALLFIEFFSGLAASLKEGKKFESRKLGRFIVKIVAYTAIIGIINIFKNGMKPMVVLDNEINIYAWIYYTTFNMIVVQLIVSVLENYSRLGYRESNKIFGLIASKLNKWFKLDDDTKKDGNEEAPTV